MKAPEMDLIAEVVVIASLEADFGRRTGNGDARPYDPCGVILHTGRIAVLARAESHAADAAAIVASPGKPPAKIEVPAGRPLAHHERIAGAVRDGGKIDAPFRVGIS